MELTLLLLGLTILFALAAVWLAAQLYGLHSFWPKRLKELEEKEADLKAQERQILVRMEEASGLTQAAAKERVIAEARRASSKEVSRIADEIEKKAQAKSAEILASVMQRMAGPSSRGFSVRVELPSEDYKPRLIGREGRNIRSFELVTQTDLIVDETPGFVSISSVDPARREAARITLINLLLDGRIHPGRIEELHQHTLQELPLLLAEESVKEAEDAGVIGFTSALAQVMGSLRLRQSLGQNVWTHSLEASRLARLLCAELGDPDVELAARAALLHDIGKALGPDWQGSHALAGRDFLKKQGEAPRLLNAVAAHHNEVPAESITAAIVILADTLSAARPGAREAADERHWQRMEGLESLAMSFEGVERAFVVQSGRELRVIVSPNRVIDGEIRPLARKIAKEISGRVEYPGGVKVTVIRESRASEVSP